MCFCLIAFINSFPLVLGILYTVRKGHIWSSVEIKDTVKNGQEGLDRLEAFHAT